MRAAALLAVAIAATPVAAARADSIDLRDLYREAQALVRSLAGPGQGSGREIIEPPGNIDPKMAFAPPGPRGTLRIVRPPEPFDRGR
jgi:hypothetical protein